MVGIGKEGGGRWLWDTLFSALDWRKGKGGHERNEGEAEKDNG